MTSRERFITALERKIPDRLPVTTHHVQPYFLQKYLNGITNDEFFDKFGLDPILWINAYKPDEAKGEYHDPEHNPGYLEAKRISSDDWRVSSEEIPGREYKSIRYNFNNPGKTLSMVLESNEYTSWVSERLIKRKKTLN